MKNDIVKRVLDFSVAHREIVRCEKDADPELQAKYGALTDELFKYLGTLNLKELKQIYHELLSGYVDRGVFSADEIENEFKFLEVSATK